MTSPVYFYNEFSDTYLAVDPSKQGYELRAFTPSDTPLAFTISPTGASAVKICTTVANIPYCLDVWGDRKYTPHLANPGDYSGQQWFVSQETSGTKFSNSYTGAGWFLDVYNETNEAFMSSGDYAGQYWRKDEVISTPSPSPTPTEPRAAQASNSSSGLSAGAKAGIGAGCAVVALLIALILGVLLWRRRRTRQNPVTTVATVTTPEKHQAFMGTAELPVPLSSTYAHEKHEGSYGDRGELPGSHQVHELASHVISPSPR